MRLIDAEQFVTEMEINIGNVYNPDIIKGMRFAIELINSRPTAFDKEKVTEELKSWEKASYNAGIQNNYVGLDNKASGYYQESRAYHRAIEIVEKGGIE